MAGSWNWLTTRAPLGGANKCNQYDYRCMIRCKQFEGTFESTQWRGRKKCNQCDYAFCRASDLRTNLKTHSGAKSNKCNQCDYSSSQAGHLRTHLKIHSGEKPKKCNQCDFASSRAGNLRRHLKTHSGKSQTNATNVTLPALIQDL